MDSYTIALSTSATVTGASTDTEVGGTSVYASENYRYEVSKTTLNFSISRIFGTEMLNVSKSSCS